METALIVSSTDAGIKALFRLLKDLHLIDVQFAMNSGEARRRLAGQSYDLAVINTPLRDEFGSDLACHIAGTTLAGVVLLVKADYAAQIDAKVQPSGVFVLEKPLSRSMFQYTVRMMDAMEHRLRLLKRENQHLQSKIEEIRLVDRAKLVLMECLKMSEESAHYYIEHQAMNMRCTKTEIAQSVIRTYKN